MEENDEDQRLPHHRNPKQFVSLDHLAGFSLSSLHSLLHTLLLYKSLFQLDWGFCRSGSVILEIEP